MKQFYPLLASLPLLFLAGCSASGPQVNPLKGLAASFVYGRAVDQAQLANQRHDINKLDQAFQMMVQAQNTLANRKNLPDTSNTLAGMGGLLLDFAKWQPEADREKYLELAGRRYRAAIDKLEDEGGIKAVDANTLNSIGYYLADHGKSLDDWNRAVTLTKAAYDQWPIPEGPAGIKAKIGRTVGAQDSYAWALCKSGRFQEALVQQEEVLSTLRDLAPEQLSAEVVYHMAEIYRQVGDRDKALREYEVALTMTDSLDKNLKSRILYGIKALKFKQV